MCGTDTANKMFIHVFKSNKRALNGSQPCFSDFLINKTKELFRNFNQIQYQNFFFASKIVENIAAYYKQN